MEAEILYAVEYVFSLAAIIGMIVSLYNQREASKNRQALLYHLSRRGIRNGGRSIIANMTYRRSVFSFVLYALLLVVGMIAISQGIPRATTTSISTHVTLFTFALILLAADLWDAYDRWRAQAIIRRQYHADEAAQSGLD